MVPRIRISTPRIISLCVIALNVYLCYGFWTAPSFKKFGKRLGPVIQWNLALQLMYVAKGSPLLRLFGTSYDRLICLHIWQGRWIGALMTTHALGFLSDWWSNGVLVEKLTTPANFYAFCAWLIWCGIWLSSMEQMRRRFYRVFITVHLTSVPCLFFFLLQHYDAWRLGCLAALPAAFVLGDGICRVWVARRRWHQATVTSMGEHGEFVRMEISVRGTPMYHQYEAGQHVTVRVPSVAKWEWHPLSIVSVPGSENLILVAGVYGPWTKGLLKLAEEGKGLNVPIDLHGPFGRLDLDLQTFDSVFIVAGGIGCTFALPLLHVTRQRLSERESPDRTRCGLLWTMRQATLMNELPQLLQSTTSITSRGGEGVEEEEGGSSHAFAGVEARLHITGGGVGGMELSSNSNSGGNNLSSSISHSGFHNRLAGVRIRVGRPDVAAELDVEREWCMGVGVTRTAVFVCGPAGLCKAVIDAVKNLNADQQPGSRTKRPSHRFEVHTESFDL